MSEHLDALRNVHRLLAYLEKLLRPGADIEGLVSPEEFRAAIVWLHIRRQRLAIGELLKASQSNDNALPSLERDNAYNPIYASEPPELTQMQIAAKNAIVGEDI